MIEAAEAVRAKAKELGFEEREVMNASALWDWSLLEASCREVGLFSPKKVIDLRLASFRPGIKGAKALSDLSEMPLDNVVVIVSMPYDWSVKKLAWFKKLAVAAQFVECAPITARAFHAKGNPSTIRPSPSFASAVKEIFSLPNKNS